MAACVKVGEALEAANFFTKREELDFHFPRTFHRKYALGDKLVEGAYGDVYSAVPRLQERRWRELQLDLAVKVVAKSRIVSRHDYAAVKQEGRIMGLLEGGGVTLNVVHFIRAYEDNVNVYLIMERCVRGDASSRVFRENKLHVSANPKQEERAKLYMNEILHVVWQWHFPLESGQLLDERLLHEELDLDSPPWTGISIGANDLVKKLMERDVAKRLTADQAL
ncbi:hypothetical protein PsorP6_009196 [Peronosclerospora sorghi]|uniref:Uncharacterized protein n=1 Tax=Peronosclerospora sorghi TaxID=230839 RepID=A0ACC0W287_9STRA|nr:hypothetical protein PsorP6_009196 [Peronosclerospora sorghi]